MNALTSALANGCFPSKPQGSGGREMLSRPLTVIGLVGRSFAKEGGRGSCEERASGRGSVVGSQDGCGGVWLSRAGLLG